jgi:transketolase
METNNEKLIHSLEKKAKKVRQEMVRMLHVSKSPGAHYGGSLSVTDILTTLYFHVLNIDPKNKNWKDRDRFILSKGHACAALCTVLAETGYFPRKLLNTFNQFKSPFGVHPDMHKIPGCDISAGSLGHGLPIGVGMALSGKIRNKKYRVYVAMGDGEMGEGSCWEAMMAGAHYKLDNICGIIDRNRMNQDGPVEKIMNSAPLENKVASFGWEVIICDGHNIEELLSAFNKASKVIEKPSMIIANTIKGKGISFMENQYSWHYGKPDEKQLEQICNDLGMTLG